MKKVLPLIAALIVLTHLSAGATAAAASDTLFHTATASHLSASFSSNQIKITITDVDQNSKKNYYYQTTSSGISGNNSTGVSISSPVDVTVVETDSTVCLSFGNQSGNTNQYVFPIDTTGTRSVQSYLGTNPRDVGLVIGSHSTSSAIWEMVSGGLSIGMTIPYSSSLSSANNIGFEAQWLNILAARVRKGRSSFSLGIGLTTRIFSMPQGSQLFKGTDGTISLRPFPDRAEKRSSQLQISTLQFPLLYNLSIGTRRNCGVHLGAILDLNLWGVLNSNYAIGDEHYSIRTTGIGQRKVSTDLFFAVSWQAIGIYGKYSPLNVMSSRSGIDLKSISVGLILGF